MLENSHPLSCLCKATTDAQEKPQSETVGEGGACQHFNSLKDAQLVALFIVSWSFYLKEIIHNHSKIYSLVNY